MSGGCCVMGEKGSWVASWRWGQRGKEGESREVGSGMREGQKVETEGGVKNAGRDR